MNKFEQIVNKFGKQSVHEYFLKLKLWLYGDTGKDIAEYLFKNVQILNTLSPLPPIPKVLYRGLFDLSEVPKPKQNIIYSTSRGYASFSEDTSTAREFCAGNEIISRKKALLFKQPDFILEEERPFGKTRIAKTKASKNILIEVSNEEISKQKIIYYPLSEDILKLLKQYKYELSLTNEREWLLYFVSPMKVNNWYYCVA